MKAAKVTIVTEPKTKPPGKGPYVCLGYPDGTEEWVQLAMDSDDGVPASLDKLPGTE